MGGGERERERERNRYNVESWTRHSNNCAQIWLVVKMKLLIFKKLFKKIYCKINSHIFSNVKKFWLILLSIIHSYKAKIINQFFIIFTRSRYFRSISKQRKREKKERKIKETPLYAFSSTKYIIFYLVFFHQILLFLTTRSLAGKVFFVII